MFHYNNNGNGGSDIGVGYVIVPIVYAIATPDGGLNGKPN